MKENFSRGFPARYSRAFTRILFRMSCIIYSSHASSIMASRLWPEKTRNKKRYYALLRDKTVGAEKWQNGKRSSRTCSSLKRFMVNSLSMLQRRSAASDPAALQASLASGTQVPTQICENFLFLCIKQALWACKPGRSWLNELECVSIVASKLKGRQT
jgi:hypothetical protein